MPDITLSSPARKPDVTDKDLEWIADIIFIAKRDDGDIYDTARKIIAYLTGAAQ